MPGPAFFSAFDREEAALQIALPWALSRSIPIVIGRIRAEREPLGLTAEEATTVRTVALAWGARISGVTFGSTEFRIEAPAAPTAPDPSNLKAPATDLDADLAGASISSVVARVMASAPGAGAELSLTLRGSTMARRGFSTGHLLSSFALHAGQLGVSIETAEIQAGFEGDSAGLWRGRISARPSGGPLAPTPSDGVFDARRRGELQSVRIETQSIRARAGSSERLVADTRARLWEALRVEPEVSSASRRDGSPGLALSVQLNFAAGAATFEGLRGREGSPEDLSRAVVAEALSFIDSEATTDPRTQRELVALAVARRQGFRLRAPRSGDVEILRGVMEDLGAIVRERSAEPAVPGDPMLPVFEAEEDAGLLSLTLRPV